MVLTRAAAIAIASSAALAVVLASSVAVADGTDSDGDGVPDQLEDATQRTVAASVTGDQFSVSSHLGSGAVEDEFDLSYHAGTFSLWYTQSGGVDSSYELQVANLQTWQDLNGSGRMDPGEVSRTSTLGPAFTNARVVASNRTDADGGVVYTFLVRSNDGNVSLNVTLAQRFERIDGAILSPMEARLDLSVRQGLATSGENLALGFRMGTYETPHLEDHSWHEACSCFAADEHEINITASGEGSASTVFFSWSNKAVAGGTSIPVAFTGPSASNPYGLTLSYSLGTSAPASTVVQHTTLGVRSAVYEIRRTASPEVRGDLPLFAGTFAAVATLVGVTIVLASRRAKHREETGRKP